MIERLNNNDQDFRAKINEIIDSVNDHEEMLYGCGCDNDDDMALDDDTCLDCQLQQMLGTLDDLSDEQVQRLCDEAEGELERRSQAAMMDNDYCEQCNDYHGLPDDDEEVTETVKKVVDDVRGKNHPLKRVDTTDGLFSDFTAYVAQNPELRLWQAVRNWSGYSTIYGIDGVKPINLDTLEDTFYLKTKGPKKGGKS